MTSTPLIQLEDVNLRIDQRDILKQITLQVHAGEILTLVGPNGAGKTSLVRVVLGLIAPSSGRVERANAVRIGYLPQTLHIPPTLPLTAERFLTLSASRTIDHHQIQHRLEQVHLSRRVLQTPVQQLSGGEMQRLLLARALLTEPQLLVLDEPAQGVDVSGQRELYRLIGTLRDQTGCAVLMVSHDLHIVMAATDRVLCLNQHICCFGHPQEVSKNPAYLKLFGMEGPELAVYTHHHNHQHHLDGQVTQEPPSC